MKLVHVLLGLLLLGSAVVIASPTASACTDRLGCNGFGHCWIVYSSTDELLTPGSGVPSVSYPSGYECVW
jgi:hypothetical protein